MRARVTEIKTEIQTQRVGRGKGERHRSSGRKENEEKNGKNGTYGWWLAGWGRGRTFTLQPKMKIVLSGALMRGQRSQHYIRVSERRCQPRRPRSALLDSHQCASSIIRSSDSSADSASGCLPRISIRPDRTVNIAHAGNNLPPAESS